MKKRLLSLGVMLAMVVSILCSSVVIVRAEENKQLDVVLVLDQSGSMKSNDPDGMMKAAANMLIEMMPSKTGRIGVISFNRKQTKVAELTELSEIDSVSSLIDRVNAIEYKGDTDIGNAVADAVEMFDKNDGRVHAILVLSDGRNDFGIDRNEEQKSDERLYDALIAAENQNCQIYCLGFGEEMSNVDDVPYDKLLSIASSPEKISTETNPGNIYQFFVKMLADMVDAKIQHITDNKITIEQNVKEANIYMSSTEDLSEVSIGLKGPNGNEIVLQNSESVRFYKDKYSAVIKLFEPEAGEYIINTSTDQIEIVVGYIPSYEYVLSSSVVDEMGNVIEKIDNGKTAEIRTVIQQDGADVTDAEVYSKVDATAVVTAKDTGEETTVNLTYQDGELRGEITFDHLATYAIDITVEADSYQLEDSLEITTNQRAVSLNGGLDAEQIEKKKIDKTFKKSADLLVGNEELMSIVSDPDQVGVKIDQVLSSDEEKVQAQLTEDGLLLTGTKWGSSIVSVVYKDGLGNTVQTSFTVKVEDKLLVAFFAILPVLIVACILLAVYFVMRKSRMVKGDFEISRIEIRQNETVSIVNDRKNYRANVFVGRKKTLGNGIVKYAQDVYSSDASLPQNQELYKLFANNQKEMKQNLDEVKIIGTYLGRRGCSVKIKRGVPVSMSSNREYGKAVKLIWPTKASFKVYTKDSSGTEICIDGTYNFQLNNRASGKKSGRNSGKTYNPSLSGRETTSNTNPTYSDIDDFFS